MGGGRKIRRGSGNGLIRARASAYKCVAVLMLQRAHCARNTQHKDRRI